MIENRKKLYLGKAGQLYIMSEFLARNWNVAIPEVDVGDDVLILQDATHDFYPLQVKTANHVKKQYGYSAQFNVPVKQLELDNSLHFVFVVRFAESWSTSIVIIPRFELLILCQQQKLGVPNQNGNLTLYFRYYTMDEKTTIQCQKEDFTKYDKKYPTFL